MAPSKHSSNRSTDASTDIRASYSSCPQYQGENDQYHNHDHQQNHQSTSCSDQPSSLDCVQNNPVDLQDPFFSVSYCESSYLSSRFENEYGRVYSPSLSFSNFGQAFNSSSNDIKGGGASGSGGVDGSTAVTSMDYPRDFETAFCRDFYCCGTTLCDLHDLLQHYEECHVRFEEEEEDEYDNEYDDMDDTFDSGEDSWSESDSLPSSPSTASPLPSSMLRLDGTQSSDRSNRGASTIRNGCGSPSIGRRDLHQRPSVFDYHRHRQSYRLDSLSNIHSRHPYFDNTSPTTYPLEAISTTFGGPTKRKAVVSLADLYVGENHGNDLHSFAFGNTILSSNRSTTLNSMNEHLIGPLTKRQALESNEFTIASGHQFSAVRNLAGTFPNTIIGGDGKPIGPLTGSNHRTTSRGGAAAPATFPINGESPPAATVDWMRQRDEVFSILEDMAKTPPNASDETKPYRCTVPGCDKSYKNANGLKYHNQHGHSSHGLGDADSPETRPYICTFLECGKRYKNLNGLKYHIEHTHPNLIAALKAHQAALMTNMNPLLVDGSYVNHQAAAMTIAAALAAIGASSMMAMAANAVLAAHAAAAATAAATSNSTATSSTRPTLGLIGLPTVTSALQEPNSTAEQ